MQYEQQQQQQQQSEFDQHRNPDSQNPQEGERGLGATAVGATGVRSLSSARKDIPISSASNQNHRAHFSAITLAKTLVMALWVRLVVVWLVRCSLMQLRTWSKIITEEDIIMVDVTTVLERDWNVG